MPKPLHLIVACAENRVMGRAGQLPWHIPEDFQFFQNTTAGHIVVMGRICFESWAGAARDGRRPVVITRDHTLARDGVFVAETLTAALAIAETLPGEIFVCGGQRIYAEAMLRPEATHLTLTLIHAAVEGDRYFPEWRKTFGRVLSRRDSADENWRYTFLSLERGPTAV